MFIGSFVATPWGSNCYIVAAAASGPCLVIDPGITSHKTLSQVVRENDFEPVSVVCTHGHIDHAGDAAAVAEEFNCPVWLHPADRQMLSRPMTGLSPDAEPMVASLIGEGLELAEPAQVNDLADQLLLTIADITLEIKLAPGHTKGSCLIAASHGTESGPVFTGDVLFAGAIGRMDMPGGSQREMAQTLSEVIPSYDADLTVLPGHGQPSTFRQERLTNPYLKPAIIAQLRQGRL